MLRIITYLLCVSLLWSCSASKSGGKRGESGEVEPEQLRPTVDTRFQELFFQAQLEKAKGNPKKAYELFEAALKIESGNGAAHYELGKADLGLSNPASALEHAKVCVASDDKNPWYFDLLGAANHGLAKYDVAIKAYREAVRLSPDNSDFLDNLLQSQLAAGKLADAIASYDEIEKRYGAFEYLFIEKHALYMELNEREKAGKELEKLAEQFPDEPRYWGMVAQHYQRCGMKDKAVMALERMVKADPNNGQVHMQLSEFYATQQDEQRSYDELKLAFGTTDISIDQKIAILLRYYTLSEMVPSQLGHAYELLELAEKTQPSEPKIYAMYGDFLYRDGKLAEALTKYKRAIALGGSLSTVWSNVLEIEFTLGNVDALYADSKSALDLFPLMPEFYYFRGVAMQRKSEHRDAIEQFNLGKELVLDNRDLKARFYASLGESYHYTQQYEQCDEAFNESFRLDPANVFALNNYAYYLALRNVKLDQAVEMARRVNELSPGVSSFEDTYAYALFRKGLYNDALTWIEKALAHKELSPELLEHYGDILAKLGRVDDALNQWKQADALPGAGPKLKAKIAAKQYID
ncbi:MAG: tetratricopeptide repeat protein [Flavobacteriales bacterium]